MKYIFRAFKIFNSNHDRFNKYFYTCVEEVMSKMHGNVERFVCIMDMKNLSYKNVDLMLG